MYSEIMLFGGCSLLLELVFTINIDNTFCSYVIYVVVHDIWTVELLLVAFEVLQKRWRWLLSLDWPAMSHSGLRLIIIIVPTSLGLHGRVWWFYFGDMSCIFLATVVYSICYRIRKSLLIVLRSQFFSCNCRRVAVAHRVFFLHSSK